MADVRRGKVDVVCCWRFDRFARSVKHLVTALDDFNARGVDFVSLNDNIDTSTASGRFVFTVFAAVAELERAIIGERVKAGLAAAKRRGVKLGRKRVHVDVDKARALRAEGASLRKIAAALGVGLATLHRALKTAEPDVPMTLLNSRPEKPSSHEYEAADLAA
jgi:DNA invertase Pin-like site-specific DNA recombinase